MAYIIPEEVQKIIDDLEFKVKCYEESRLNVGANYNSQIEYIKDREIIRMQLYSDVYIANINTTLSTPDRFATEAVEEFDNQFNDDQPDKE